MAVTVGMTATQRAFLDAQVALSAWRAAKDVEAQVAHWLVEGRATREDPTFATMDSFPLPVC